MATRASGEYVKDRMVECGWTAAERRPKRITVELSAGEWRAFDRLCRTMPPGDLLRAIVVSLLDERDGR